MKEKKKKQKYVDDGHTVYNMDGVGHSGWWPFSSKKTEKKEENPIWMTRKERWAVIRAAMTCYLPVLLIIVAGFSLAMVLMLFWLR